MHNPPQPDQRKQYILKKESAIIEILTEIIQE
jgi:hypothetical protein